jgi:CheY-like chemotaxis protein
MPLKIVYLDDEPDICIMFSDNFNSPNLIIHTFTDSDLAVNFIKLNPPDIVFLDYRMPNINGDQVAIRIDKDIPKVLITGDLEVVTESIFIKKFGKPFPWTEIEQLLEDFRLKKDG